MIKCRSRVDVSERKCHLQPHILQYHKYYSHCINTRVTTQNELHNIYINDTNKEVGAYASRNIILLFLYESITLGPNDYFLHICLNINRLH